MSGATLRLDIQSYWHPGTGRGSGFHLDAVTHTGADRLPRLPGRTLKGLLRDAMGRAEAWHWPGVPSGTTNALFGSRGDADERHTSPGLLRVSDATLPEEIAAWLSTDDEGKRLIPGLYREHFSTAIDAGTGVALGRSLRGMQVVIPLVLEARIDLIPAAAAPPDWKVPLRTVLPLVTGVGAHRTRGFGRSRLSLAEG